MYTRRPVFAHVFSDLKRNARLAAISQFKIESVIDLAVILIYIYQTIFIYAGFVRFVILISVKELTSNIIA